MTTLSRVVLSSVLLVMLSPVNVQAEGGLSNPSDPVTVTEVKVRFSDHGPVVLLQAEGKAIPIFVDLTVALSIHRFCAAHCNKSVKTKVPRIH